MVQNRYSGIRPLVRFVRREILKPSGLLSFDSTLSSHTAPSLVSHEFLRGGQLDCDELELLIRANNLSSVVNLRGDRSGRSSYDEELEVCNELGVRYHPVRMSSMEPSKVAIQKYLGVLADEHNYPMFAHCAGNWDRAGFATAIYRIARMKERAGSSRKELNPNPHKDSTLHRFINDFEVLGEPQGMSFSQWVNDWDGKGYEQKSE